MTDDELPEGHYYAGDAQPINVQCAICKTFRVVGSVQPVMSPEGLRLSYHAADESAIARCPKCGSRWTLRTETVTPFMLLEDVVRQLPHDASVDAVVAAYSTPDTPPGSSALRTWLIEHSVELAGVAIAIPALVLGILQYSADDSNDPAPPTVIVENTTDPQLLREIRLLRRELRQELTGEHPGGEGGESHG